MIDIWGFARRYLYPYKVKGNDINAMYCPYCHGGKHRDKYTFGLSIDKKIFNCLRGSCAVAGTFNQLCESFGEVAEKMNYELNAVPRYYKKPETQIKTISSDAEKYMALRKISKATMDMYQVGSDDKGNIVFPYYDENNELMFVKFRPAKKIGKGERKMWRESDTKPILFGMNKCEIEQPLIITEGEIDMLSCIESGLKNVVSVPSGTNDLTWMDTCWNWLKQFKEIILFTDNDEPGRELTRELTKRFNGEYIVKIAQYHEKAKDANELLYRHGKELVIKAIETAEEIPVAGLIRLADVKPLDVKSIPKIRSGIDSLDKKMSGFLEGELSVWTGKRGEGKSTVLGQVLVEAVEQGKKVCAYSGELMANWFQYWIDLQAAGSENIESYVNAEDGKTVYYVPEKHKKVIHEWYKDLFWMYDNEITIDGNEEMTILKVFQYAVKRYNCKVFLVDNLMTANFHVNDTDDYYRAQGKFTGELVSFARTFGVHVHLVAHPKKGNITSCDDISGIGEITNRAHNVFNWAKLNDEDAVKEDCNAILEIFKNRAFGATGKLKFKYDEKSRRLFNREKQYGWEKNRVFSEKEQAQIMIQAEEECPF